eukprot:TRINITY_DN14652_c0_g1_i1.p2 TRINITY_DN14652_c0_g1~~TRINITY_DN14652_c0_g1_i1.p2  ORF type:complete len:304 (+),score=125.88 TRINITY_DN14652_c0_g1_i1:115-1026(+)
MPFGQLVFGHPGSGKTTYCAGLAEYLTGIGRKVAVVNLDPANDALPYEAQIDVRSLIDHKVAMEEEALGPNGAFLFCLEYLQTNRDWLGDAMQKTGSELGGGGWTYFLFDCPGQVELYTNHDAFRDLVTWMQKDAHIKLCGVHLVDSLYCRSGPHFISAVLMSLTSMLQLELPHINVLTKIDLLKNYELDFGLDFYTEVQDLSHLLHHMKSDDAVPKRFHRMNDALAQLVEDYPHVAFLTLDIDSQDAVQELMTEVDKANGYSFQTFQHKRDTASNLAATASSALQSDYVERFTAQEGNRDLQ